ncbi:hypothetical protein OPV22_015995 [Ensete ventricosum]|uniref:DUF4283 domain-containing protein n=1 Tax=Ensete ventricosum TaxID=4639 RepID=A0AAV8PMR0_ENSVE|nr:hypothetical protein OPV22_015995 [Ensete ventricosum]
MSVPWVRSVCGGSGCPRFERGFRSPAASGGSPWSKEVCFFGSGDGYGSWVFLFRFASDCDRLKVLLEGPWSIFGGRNFAFDSMETTLPPILEEWVQLPTLRFEYNWEHETIFRIASLIDRPLKIDDCSMTFERWRNCECPKKNPVMEPSKETLRVVARCRNNRPLGMMPPLRLVSPPLRLWIASTGQVISSPIRLA